MLIVDLSSNNKAPDFKTLARHVQGAWIKATEGVGYTNPVYSIWKGYADHYGIRTGAYHFAQPDIGPIQSAERFCEVVGKIGRRDLRPVLDFETWDNKLTPAEHEAWARTFNQTVRKHLGIIPIFYSYGPFIDRLQLKKPVGDGLWEAAYGRDDGKSYPFAIAHPWKRTVAHQFTSKASVLGANGPIDLSYAPRLDGVLAHPILGLL